jgi:hypothetical protein
LARWHELPSRDLVVTCEKLLKRDIFGLEKYLRPGAPGATWELSCSDELRSVVGAVNAFTRVHGVDETLRGVLCRLTTALVESALARLPSSLPGGSPSRLGSIQVPPPHELSVSVACDGERAGVSVNDSFGVLTAERALDDWSACIRNNSAHTVSRTHPLSDVCHGVINLCPSLRTEVMGLLETRGGFRERVSRGMSFNLFLTDRP